MSCEAYHKNDQRQNSLLKIQEILKRDMDMDFTGVHCFQIIEQALSMLKNYNTLNKCIFLRIFVDDKGITYKLISTENYIEEIKFIKKITLIYT